MIKPIEDCKGLTECEIIKRSENSTKGKFTKHFIVYKANTEIAFVSLDINKDRDHLVLYELLVPVKKRHEGNGSLALCEVEKLALNMKFKKILVYPKPFEGEYTKEQLIEWYKSKNYKAIEGSTGELEKLLSDLYS